MKAILELGMVRAQAAPANNSLQSRQLSDGTSQVLGQILVFSLGKGRNKDVF
jgi:hypothetical protein